MSVIFLHPRNSSKIFKKPKIFSCYVCSSTFTQMSNLRKHLRNIHRVQMNLRRKGTDFTCLICSLTFSRKTNLKRHQVTVHKMDGDKLEYSIRFLCNACTAAFDDQASLRTHRKNRHGENDEKIDNPYECGECGELFEKKSALKNHLRYRHLSETDSYQFLRNILPSMTSSVNVIWYSVLNEAEEKFKAKFTMSIRNKAELEKWINEFQDKNKITLRKRSVHPTLKSNIIYHVKYGCHHNTKPKAGATHVSAKHTKCQASIALKLFALSSDTRNYAEVRLIHAHNHVLDSLEVLKYREPTEEVKKKFRNMFMTGMTPAQALLQHKKDLEQQYGDEYSAIIGDRGICPNKSWVYNYRGTCFRRKDKHLDDDTSVENTSESNFTKILEQEVCSGISEKSPSPSIDHLNDSSNSENETIKDYLADIDFTMVNKTILTPVRNIVHIPYNADISNVQVNCSKVVFSTVPTLRKIHDFPTFGNESDIVESSTDSSKLFSRKEEPIEDISLDTSSDSFVNPTVLNDSEFLLSAQSINPILNEDEMSLSDSEKSIFDSTAPPEETEETVIVNSPLLNNTFHSEDDPSHLQNVFEEFDRMNEEIKEKACKNNFLVAAMQQMIFNFHQNLQDLTALNDALCSFGDKNIGR